MGSPAAVRRIHPPCAIACSRSDRGANSSTVSKVSATVERSGSTRSIREDKVRTLIRTTWLTGPNDDSPAIPPVPWTTPGDGASTDPAVGAAIADPADGLDPPDCVADGEPAGTTGAACGEVNTDGGANPDGRGPAGSISSGRRGWTSAGPGPAVSARDERTGRLPDAGSTGSITIPHHRRADR